MNVRTIVLVFLGLVLMSAIVLSTTALASVLILGDLHWKRVVVAAGFWLLAFGCWFLAASLQQCIASPSRDAHPAAIIREANAVRRPNMSRARRLAHTRPGPGPAYAASQSAES
jgi:amino acid permease